MHCRRNGPHLPGSEVGVAGELLIDLEDRTVTLAPGQGFVVPRGVRHRTRAPGRTIILMVENAGIVPTGDPA